MCDISYTMTDKKIRAVRDWQSTTQVRQLLDLVNYHKRSIQDFAIVGKPISDIILVGNCSKEDTNNQKKKTKNPPKRNSISSKTLIVWNQEH